MRDREVSFEEQRPRPRYDAILKIAKRLGVAPPPISETYKWFTPAVGHPAFEGTVEVRLLLHNKPRRRVRAPRDLNGSQVYLVSGSGLIKIGTAKNVAKRIADLQIGSPVKLALLLSFAGDLNVEQQLHRRFASLREHGEWFRAEEALLAFVAEMRRRLQRRAA